MSFVSRISLCVCVTLMLLASLVLAAGEREGTSTVAGWVDVQADVAPYVVLRVVDASSGVVVRSAPLDATHTFSFAGVAPSAFAVEAVAQLPDHLFELDAASSVLRVAVNRESTTAPVQLKVSTTSKASAAAAAAAHERAAAAAGSSPVSAALAFAALVAAWAGRHQIVSALNMPGFKAPKQRKMMVGM